MRSEEKNRANLRGSIPSGVEKEIYCRSKGYTRGGSQPQKFLVRATFSSFSRPSHLEILVLRILSF